MDDLSQEPVFRHVAPTAASDDAGVAGEPALADAPSAAGARVARRDWLVRQWTESAGKTRLGVFIGLCAVSGLFAIVCALAKNSLGLGVLAVVIGAPVVEEVGKAAGPLMLLEKRPWLFGGAASVVLVGLVTGLVFASVENLLYFFNYIDPNELTRGIILWRLVVCTAVHVACATTSHFGLARAWSRAAREKGSFALDAAVPYLIAAVALHGVYNLCAVLYSSL